ncbi:hypothetical protein CGLO_13056 [Colletotrichum gloeosporioides Cg-14]|uniref:Uncharacterized protein n=1 Tax=Colletotrichum gloeosporioides (strain Cg-14) TaxID=1237896 RepID=T0K4H0_COLGC|nr:hypothetical protein CGLO_13056 [Colletotrichum gloeosporioides Cg-14]
MISIAVVVSLSPSQQVKSTATLADLHHLPTEYPYLRRLIQAWVLVVKWCLAGDAIPPY